MTVDIDRFIELLSEEVKTYNVPVVDLIAVQTEEPFKILVATILSARTKDETTAKATSKLFKKARNIKELALLTEQEITKLIYPVGFYKNKARFLKQLPSVLKEKFNNEIPTEVEPLTKLPGVGRKTANLVVSVAFNKPAICVDTHVHRIMNIWGYVKTKTPLETEMALRKKLPEKYWIRINSLLVAFGQGTCKPLAPHCDRCILTADCPKIGVTPRRLPNKTKKKQSQNMQRFISWNVNGLRAVEKKGFTDIVRDLDADIIALQEIKAHPDQLSTALKEINGYHSYWNPAVRKGYAGVAVYSRKPPLNVINGIGTEEYDQEGRVLTLEFADFYFINVYFPNAQHGLTRMDYKLDFNRQFLAFVNDLAQDKSVVICGDYNVAHKPVDLKNPKTNEKNPGYTAEERAWMDEFIGNGYIDTFRKFNKDPDNYTWWSYRFNARARNIGWRIDYFCVDRKSEKRVRNAEILNEIEGSDHCPVSLEFE